MNSAERRFHVLVCDGDASAEVEALLARLGTPEEAGLHRYFFVTRANQTVVMARDADAAIVRELRVAGGWESPEEA